MRKDESALAPAKVRMAWPDVARGLSIFGVMLLHSTMVVPGGVETEIEVVNRIIGSLRMPMFFMVSGFFAVKVFRFNLIELFTKRIWFLLVPYLLWTPAEVFLAQWKLHLNYDYPLPPREFYWETMRTAQNLYWFLWALILFTVVLWFTKFLPPVVRYVLPFVIIAVTPWFVISEILVLPRVLAYLPLFLIGAYARDWIKKFADQALTRLSLIISTVLVVLAIALNQIELSDQTRPVRDVIVSLLLLPFAVTLSVGLAKVPVVGTAMMALGRNTLVAYLGHPIFLSLVFGILLHDGLGFEIPAQVWVGVCLGISFIGTVAMYGVSKVPILRWSISPPKLPDFFPQGGRQ